MWSKKFRVLGHIAVVLLLEEQQHKLFECQLELTVDE
jgi:hypothetical protein